MALQEPLILLLVGDPLRIVRTTPEANRLAVAANKRVAVLAEADEAMLTGSPFVQAAQIEQGVRRELVPLGLERPGVFFFQPNQVLGLLARFVLEVGLKLAGGEHKAIEGCEPFGARLVSAQAEAERMFALGQFQRAKLVPSHRAGIVLTVGRHVEPLLDPLDVAGLAPVGPVLFLQGLRIKPDPIATIQLVADAGTRICTQPEMIRAGRGDSQIVFSPAIVLTWLGEVGDLRTAGEFCGVHGIEPGVAVRLAPRGILAFDPQERRLRSPRQSNHAGHAGPNDSQQILSQDLSPTKFRTFMPYDCMVWPYKS